MNAENMPLTCACRKKFLPNLAEWLGSSRSFSEFGAHLGYHRTKGDSD